MDSEKKNGALDGDDAGDQQEDGTKRELTAAQKKREKLKLKKLMAQQQEEGGDTAESTATDGVANDSQEVGGEADGDDKKKKKKKKPAAKEEPKPKETSRKGPSKAQIALIQEGIRKAREEEERLLREEEEKDQQLNEAEDARLEKLRLEQERKERKKLKEKEKKERLKAEGKWLTPKQKLEKQKQQAMLESLKAQGIEVPEAGTEKKPRPGTRVRPKKLQSQASLDRMANETNGSENNAEANKTEQSEAEALAEVLEVKEAWDEESEEEEVVDPKTTGGTETQTEQKTLEKSSEEDSDSEDDEDGTSDDEDDDSGSESDSVIASETGDNKRKEKESAQIRIQKRREENEKGRSLKNLRAPVVCVLGHVDTGKTKILDKLRRTHVQDNEAGGITQQIGATNVPITAIKDSSKFVKNFAEMELKIPGLLIIDTPGHESFSNLRSRGSSLCDIAILVVDIMHGLEPQTIESLNLLKSKKTPFVVALNKIDRLYEWQSSPKRDISDVIKCQPKNTAAEFEKRKQEVIVQFAEQGLNAALFDENPDIKTYISMIPTSAFTGDGMGNLMALIVELSQSMLAKRLMYSKELQATVLEVKAIPGLGTTIDVILINGFLRVSETLVIAGTDGPITTQIRSLLTPDGMKELRVKNKYVDHKEISGAIGVKIAATDLEKVIAGLNIQIAYHPDEVDVCREEVARELKSALNSIRLSERGVYVQASTLGSLEALLEFLKTSQIPYSGIRIGPVVKKDVMKASIMLEHDSQYAVILAFDVKIERDAQDLADNLGVRIFQADIIYHLFDRFIAYRDDLKAKKRDEFKHVAVFPCKLKILPQFIFNSRDPIVIGVIVEAGIVKDGTPICVPNREFLEIGRVTSIEINHKQVNTATKGQEVCIKIEPTGDSPKMLGRHFEETDLLVSKITRESIDACKDYFRNDLQKSDWQLMVELKKMFQIM